MKRYKGNDPIRETRSLSYIVGRMFIITAVVTMAVSVILSVLVFVQKEYANAQDLLIMSSDDIWAGMHDDMLDYLVRCAVLLDGGVTGLLDGTDKSYDDINVYLKENTIYSSFSEVNVLDDNGIVKYSSDPSVIGYDMASNEVTAEFMSNLEKEGTWSKDNVPPPNDKSQDMMYGASKIKNFEGYIMVGFDQDTLKELTLEDVKDIVRHRHLGQSGLFLVCDSDYTVSASTDNRYNGLSLAGCKTTGGRNIREVGEGDVTLMDVYGTYNFTYIVSKYDHYVIGLYPMKEAFRRLNSTVWSLLAIETILFPTVFLIVFIFLKNRVIKGIIGLNGSLEAISEGSLSEKADVRSSLEFESLSDNINITVSKLREMAEKETKMLEDELHYARSIQHSVLPGSFPAFPERKEFGIYASMNAAKEVGGDFYDFYMLSDHQLAFLIADVSGKGIPAALFMMSAKSVMKSLAEAGLSAEEIFTRANHELAGEGDKVEMFVTAWMGVLDLNTGNLTYVNAGHNPPLFIHNGSPSYIKQKSGMVLCAYDGFVYKQQEFRIDPGDSILLYTDGVTEAKDTERKNYGENRLLELMSRTDTDEDKGADVKDDCRIICERVFKDVAAYAEGEPQSDDITVLCVTYAGNNIS